MTTSRHGAELTFETLGTGAARLRVRLAEDTLLRVVGGIVRLVVEGEERLLATGDEAIVPAGAPHQMSALGADASVMMGFRAVAAAPARAAA